MKNDNVKCDFQACPLKDKCERFLYDLDRKQVDHFATMPYKESKNECRFFKPKENE